MNTTAILKILFSNIKSYKEIAIGIPIICIFYYLLFVDPNTVPFVYLVQKPNSKKYKAYQRKKTCKKFLNMRLLFWIRL
jgi:hypothetical protein